MKKFDSVDVFKNSFKILFKNLELMILMLFPVLVFIGCLIFFILKAGRTSPIIFLAETTTNLASLFPSISSSLILSLILIIFMIFIMLFVDAAIILKTHSLIQRQKTSWQEIFSNAGKRIPKFFISALLVSIFVAAGIFALIIPGIYLSIKFALFKPAVVLNKKGFGVAEAWKLSKGNWWGIFIVYLLFTMTSFLLVFIPFIGVLIQIFLIRPAQNIALTLIYHQLKKPND
ncbi:MAG: hypothetical protein QXQ79_01660 [Candidatus Nanoarchaeia archaeon]